MLPFRVLFFGLWIPAGFTSAVGYALEAESRPNIIFILVDDLRWDDLGCSGNPIAKTPHIDRIATEGAIFRNAFAATPLCSPSRASILTGLHARAHGIRDNTNHDALSHQLDTFLKRLKRVGYSTAFLGKWHMGTDDSPRPGIDHWLSFKGQGQYLNPEINLNGQVQQASGYATDILNRSAIDFLRQRHDEAADRALNVAIANEPQPPLLQKRYTLKDERLVKTTTESVFRAPARVFARLFLDGRPDEVQAQIRRLKDGRSILDQVQGQAKSMHAKISGNDREKLEEYFASVRELERRLASAEEWSQKPKPKVSVAQPRDISNPADLLGRTRLLFDLTHLALETDSTRLITIMLLGTSLVPPIPGVSDGHHNLSHHGQDPNKLEQLKIVESEKLKILRDLLVKLKQSQEAGVSLLDRTIVYFSSNLGNASSHSCRNLPVLLAGGGFQHGQHLVFDEKAKSSPPLSNLYVSMLQRMGIESDQFGSSTGTLTGLERSPA